MPLSFEVLSLAMLMFSEPRAAQVLPLQRLRLYETGVAYFERRGRIEAGRTPALPLPAAHLDDALKTLVLLDGGDRLRIEGIEFATSVSEGMARAMAGLPETVDQPTSYQDVLQSLEGAPVEVSSAGQRVRGTLVDVEGPFEPIVEKKEDDEEPPPVRDRWFAIIVVGDDGGIHRFRSDLVDSLRPTDEGTRSRLTVAARSLSEQSARNIHPLGIRAANAGRVGLGYIAEAPVWRTSYRVVLDDDGSGARLQGWALVHNDTDEDWKDVRIELVNGRPTSFLFPLAAPRYAHRELQVPEDDLTTVPQLARTTVDRMWQDGETGLGISGYGSGSGGGTGEAFGMGSLGTIGHGSGSGSGGPALGDLAELSQAQGEENGALFVYRAEQPIDLRAHHSSLIPILQREVVAESITWFTPETDQGRTGLRLENSTDQTLPAGVLAVFADGGFVGEAQLRRLKPKERQFAEFGEELDVDLERDRKLVDEQRQQVHWREQKLLVDVIVQEALELRVRNRSGRPRRVYVGLDLPRNAKLEGDAELDYDEERQTPLAVTSVKERASVTHQLRARTAARREIAVSVAELEPLTSDPDLPEAARVVLAAALEQQRRVERTEADLRRIETGLAEATAELGRLRQDVQALGKASGVAGATMKLGRRIVELEQRIEVLHEDQRNATVRLGAQRKVVHARLDRLEGDATKTSGRATIAGAVASQ